MNVALFHNYMDNIGGAEIVTLITARELKADIYTTNLNQENIKKMGFEDVLPRIHSIGTIPTAAPFKQQAALWKFRKLNLGNKYDFYIIMGDWAMSGAVNHSPNLWYVFSPLNELWQFTTYIRSNMLTWWKRPLYDAWVYFNRKLTLRYSKKIERWACVSLNTQNRIKKYYGASASIIYPPTEITAYKDEESKGYWLSVNRLAVNKRIEIQINAFAKMPEEKLIIVGSYEKGVSHFEQYKTYLESIKSENITMINWAADKDLKQFYSHCKGFITTARDEDFGMTPIEAMASGKPVIAGKEGGYKETVMDGETGILIQNINENSLAEAIKKINAELRLNPLKYKEKCLAQAKKFSTNIFIQKIKDKMNAK